MGSVITLVLLSIGVLISSCIGLNGLCSNPLMRGLCRYSDLSPTQRDHFWHMLLLLFGPLLFYTFYLLFLLVW